MKKYLKLVNFELNRVTKLYVVLLAITFVIQMIGLIVSTKRYLNLANESIYGEMMSQTEFLETYGQYSILQFIRSSWFFGPIALCIAAIGFYIFLIWYRDWVGKNTFVYRLLMLPTSRLNIFFAKITTILLLVFGLVAFQHILLLIENLVMKARIPEEFRVDLGIVSIIQSLPELSIIIPTSLIELVLYYGAGLMAVSVLFTAILMERSFKLKGILLGILYCAAAVIVLLAPLLLHEFVLDGFFYPIELLILEIIMGLIILGVSIWMSRFLLIRKITV
ncbi:hypothetical protein [Bacillus sp. PS06]|uniref:hypothetical protein n=1 Tax=Bacillus sp. PS06 TaxID=2764176 RepID=UPI00177BF48D|nr:hypothetical protein [Bacillus sp. PS06]MBD8069079.1 hypothetical protein [Bacillus sp. PS06]